MKKADNSRSKTPNLLVVCTGNICRSPIAEAMLDAMLRARNRSARVWSAGISAPLGVPPDPNAKRASSELGFPLVPDKKSAVLTIIDVQIADLILVMEGFQRHAISEMMPAATGKVFLLGHWNKTEIDDPIGESREVFDRVATEIKLGCELWVPHLLTSFYGDVG